MTRLSFVWGRLAQLVPVVLGVTVVVFFLVHMIPGDPARTILGNHATPQAVAILHHEWGLDRSVPTQYWLFMRRLFHGDLGQSLVYQTGVTSLIVGRLPATLWLLGYAAVLAVAVSIPLAVLAASRPNGVRDHVVRFVPLVGLGMPAFWIGILLILVFALILKIFPVGGYGQGLLGHLRAMFLPGLTVAISMVVVIVRSLRASLIEVLGAEYVVTARSKGITGRRVFVRHVLRNAVIPTVTVLGINIGFLVGGTLIIENVFAIPGIGSLMVAAIFNRDFPVVQGVTLVFGVMVVTVNILTDVAYALLDARVKFSR